MEYSKPAPRLSWIHRWRLLILLFCLVDLSNEENQSIYYPRGAKAGQLFSKKGNKFSYDLGEDVTLTCSDSIQQTSMTISKSEQLGFLSTKLKEGQSPKKVIHKITNIQCEQMGVYKCEFDGRKTSKTVNVWVNNCVHLSVTSQHEQGVIRSGDNVKFTCLAIHYPESMSISRQGVKELLNAEGRGQYKLQKSHIINNIQCGQMGHYECSASFRINGDYENKTSYLDLKVENCGSSTLTSTRGGLLATGNNNCEQGWILFDTKCVKGFTEKKTWNEAASVCKEQNSQLVGENAVQIRLALKDILEDIKGIWINVKEQVKCKVLTQKNDQKLINCTKTRAFMCFKYPEGHVTTDIAPTPDSSTSTTVWTTAMITSTTTATTTTEASTTPSTSTTRETTTTTVAKTKPAETTSVKFTTTELIPRCPNEDSHCPDSWYPMREKKCFKVEEKKEDYYAANYTCKNYGGNLIDKDIDDITRACILKHLGDSNLGVEIWVSTSYGILDVQTNGILTSDYLQPRPFACSIKEDSKYIPLSIHLFELNVSESTGPRTQKINIPFHKSSQSSETVNKNEQFSFTCQAIGKPLPNIWIQIDGKNATDRSSHKFSYNNTAVAKYETTADKCGELGTFTCVASNVFGNLSSEGSVQMRVTCPTKIISFDSLIGQGIGDKLEMKCVVEGYPWPDITLYRNDTGKELARKYVFDKADQLVYTIEHLNCSDMGTYECVAQGSGDPQRQKQQLIIDYCPPQLCPGEDKMKTISGSVGETKTVSICVIAYPRLSSQAWFYKNRKDPKFHVNYSTTNNLYHTVNITIKNISQNDFGLLKIEIQTDRGRKMKYTVEIKPEGPPACPTDIQVTGNGSDYMMLSWKPGFNGGDTQTFMVFYAEDGGQWTQFDTKVIGNGDDGAVDLKVSGLKPDTEYTFKVASFNKFTPKQNRNKNLCNARIQAKTDKLTVSGISQPESTTDTKDEDGNGIIVIVLCLLAAVIIIASVAAVVIYRKRRNQNDRRSLNDRHNDTSDDDEGRVNVYANMKPGTSRSGEDNQQSNEVQLQTMNEDNTYCNSKAAMHIGSNGESETPPKAKEDEGVVVFGLGDENSGRYLSDDGLIYLTVAKAEGERRPIKKKPQVKQDEDPVEYVSLDYTKTGTFTIEEKEEAKEEPKE